MGQFPHESLTPMEATPRIDPNTASKVIELINTLRRLKPNSIYGTSPAIVIAVWCGPLVKYLIDEQQCEETIENLSRAIEVISETEAEKATG